MSSFTRKIGDLHFSSKDPEAMENMEYSNAFVESVAEVLSKNWLEGADEYEPLSVTAYLDGRIKIEFCVQRERVQ